MYLYDNATNMVTTYQLGYNSKVKKHRGIPIVIFFYPLRRGGRAVEGNGFENRRTRERTVGSNPTLFAIL